MAVRTVQLQPVIASYSGENASRIRSFLDDRALAVVAQVALAPPEDPMPIDRLDQVILTELVAMHVLRQTADPRRATNSRPDGDQRPDPDQRPGAGPARVVLDTAVFLRQDIEHVTAVVTPLGRELARLVREQGSKLNQAAPAVAWFLGGVVALGQGLSIAVRESGLAADWKNYGGRYGRSKVDFDEKCAALTALGPDRLNKGVERGESFTIVHIGPGRPAPAGGAPDAAITAESLKPYVAAIERVADVASTYYLEQLPLFRSLLGETTSGRQGVSSENMMMHLWRYIRKITARELVCQGFLPDAIAPGGVLTVRYENDIELLNRFLS